MIKIENCSQTILTQDINTLISCYLTKFMKTTRNVWKETLNTLSTSNNIGNKLDCI